MAVDRRVRHEVVQMRVVAQRRGVRDLRVVVHQPPEEAEGVCFASRVGPDVRRAATSKAPSLVVQLRHGAIEFGFEQRASSASSTATRAVRVAAIAQRPRSAWCRVVRVSAAFVDQHQIGRGRRARSAGRSGRQRAAESPRARPRCAHGAATIGSIRRLHRY